MELYLWDNSKNVSVAVSIKSLTSYTESKIRFN